MSPEESSSMIIVTFGLTNSKLQSSIPLEVLEVLDQQKDIHFCYMINQIANDLTDVAENLKESHEIQTVLIDQ